MHQDFESRSTNLGFITGILCGAAVGATLGVLLAPRAGAETRRQLAESGGRLREGAGRTYAQATEGVNTLLARGRDAMERGRSAFERTRETASAQAEPYADTFGKPSVPTV
jgi:gas vesicle protein